jgi:hypothetical protein
MSLQTREARSPDARDGPQGDRQTIQSPGRGGAATRPAAARPTVCACRRYDVNVRGLGVDCCKLRNVDDARRPLPPVRATTRKATSRMARVVEDQAPVPNPEYVRGRRAKVLCSTQRYRRKDPSFCCAWPV